MPGMSNRGRDKDSPLNAREKWFVEFYAAGGKETLDNAYRSAIRAGYSPATAEAEASNWTRDPELYPNNIKPWMYYAILKRRETAIAPTVMTHNEVFLEVSKLARFNIAKFTRINDEGDPYLDLTDATEEDMAAIAEVQVEDYVEGRGEDARTVRKVKVKSWDKRGALDLLSKLHGMQKNIHSNDPDNPMPGVNVGITYDITKLTLAEAEQLQALLSKCKA